MADFTRPIPPVMPGEFSGADGHAPAERRGAAGRHPAAKPQAGPEVAEPPGEAADPDPEHQLDESA